MASVLELFNCKKLWLIHAFISSRQMVIEDGNDEGADVEDEGAGSSFM